MGAGEENFSEYLSKNFPKEFLDKCKAKGFFGGEFNFERLGFISKMMLKAAAKGKPQPHIIPSNIDRFVRDFEDQSANQFLETSRHTTFQEER